MKLCKKLRNQKNQYCASLTIEAALVVPIFLYAMVVFLFLFQFLRIHQEVQKGLDETARYYTRNARLLCQLHDDFMDGQKAGETNLFKEVSVGEMAEDLFYYARFTKEVSKQFLDQSLIVNGIAGISIRAQCDYYEEDQVDLCAYYDCRIPVLFFAIDEFSCIQRVQMKNWTGIEVAKCYSKKDQEEKKEEDEIVYVTETGTRFHTHRDCSHLKLSIESCDYSAVSKKRNKNGGKYHSCQLCCKNAKLGADSVVYITREGDCFHILGSCSGLKRTVKEMKRSEAEKSMPECSRCKKRDEGMEQKTE